MNYAIIVSGKINTSSAGWQAPLNWAGMPFDKVTAIKSSKRSKLFYLKLDFGDDIIIFELTNSEIDKKNVDKLLVAIKLVIPIFQKQCDRVKLTESQRAKRLKHNLITHNSMILQEIFDIVPQQVLSDKVVNQLQYVATTISNSRNRVAQALLRILKNASLTKAEFDIHAILDGTSAPALEFDSHRIHKLLKLAFSSFWLDFMEKNIKIVLNESTLSVKVDYRTISAILCHLLDNAVKYTLKNTEVHIHMSFENGYVVSELDMISLKIEDEDVNKLCLEQYSGINAKKLGLDGHGIGMYIIDKFSKLNSGYLEIERNCVPRNAVTDNQMIYEQNRFKLFLPKA